MAGHAASQRLAREQRRSADACGAADTIAALIAQRTAAHPQRTAVVDGDTEIGYARLAMRADAVAHALSARGVPPGSLVGICMGRTWELVATMLGVLQAGCAYVPLDPQYPRERVRYMLSHAQAAVAIVDSEDCAALCAQAPLVLRLDEVGEGRPPERAEPRADDLAYVIYTSGSTGTPKGVAVEHRNVTAMVQAMRVLLDDADLEGVLAAASVCFDPSVMEILGTLALGGTVVLAHNALAVLDLPAADRIRTAIMVPSAMQALLAAGWRAPGLRCAVLGGEVLAPALVAQLHALRPRPRVFNVYGPTEDTVFSTASEVSPGAQAITIGTPVANSRCYILDALGQPVPAGVPGELHLAGDKLARGYLHDEERTRQRFVAVDPDGPVPERRLYRTGDRCRWRDDGEIEFLGRLDQQVKLRGFRIELEEIESALASMHGVEGAAATVVDTGGGRKMLVGYVTGPAHATAGEAAREFLAARLPGYMVPQAVVHLEQLPRLPNGKLDRDRLPDPGLGRSPDSGEPLAQAAPPAAATPATHQRHAALLSIVRREIAQILGIRDPEQIQAHRPVQALGLDSLDSVELSHRLATALACRLPASLVNDHPTPAAIADYLLGVHDRDSRSASPPPAHGAAADTLGRLQAEIQSGHPPFLAAKAAAWSATDKATLVREFGQLLGRQGRDPYAKFLRTGSAHAGTVTDAHSGEERDAIIWTTNLYLGLNRDPDVMAQARSALDRFGTGMGTSATASGVTDLHLDFEKAFAALVGKPAACLFPTGFTANLGAIAGLLGERDVLVMDQLCHASIVDGARLCGARIRTFRHNDPADLASVLEAEASPYRTILVAVEGVYSMGEGTAPLRDLVRTAKRYGALVLVDEAHSFGFYGPRGAGLCAAQGVAGEVDFIMTTLSKAMGSLGGVVAASEAHVALLKSSARAYVFQATSTPADIAAALAALRRLSTDGTLQERLWDTTHYMRKRFSDAGYDLGTGDGPIVTPHFSDSDKLYAIARGLNARGVHTAAVTYPIVERGRGRLRFICSAAHTRAHVDRTLQALIEAEREVDAQRSGAARTDATDIASHDADASAPEAAASARQRIDAWATAFCAQLQQAHGGAQGYPALAISIGLPDGGEPVVVRIDAHGIGRDADSAGQLPSCSLRLAETQAVDALCACDVRALLQGVLTGGCALEGRTEPFVWLVARLAQWRQVADD